PEHEVDVGVRLRDFGPAGISDAQCARLLSQVCVLPTGHAVYVDLGRTRADVALERPVQLARLLPISGQHTQLRGIDPRIAWPESQRLDDGPQVRLRRKAAHRIDRAVNC